MTLKTATIIALIFTVIGAIISLTFVINSTTFFLGRGGIQALQVLMMLKESSLALFFLVLYTRQGPSE
jgi:amino acid transporter